VPDPALSSVLAPGVTVDALAPAPRSRGRSSAQQPATTSASSSNASRRWRRRTRLRLARSRSRSARRAVASLAGSDGRGGVGGTEPHADYEWWMPGTCSTWTELLRRLVDPTPHYDYRGEHQQRAERSWPAKPASAAMSVIDGPSRLRADTEGERPYNRRDRVDGQEARPAHVVNPGDHEGVNSTATKP